ncbi:hypothetical protein NHJ13051_000257 [Beauveria bassiana]
MSTAAAPRKFEFLVIVPDKPGTQQKRLEVRASAHLAEVKPRFENGTYKMGGESLQITIVVPHNESATNRGCKKSGAVLNSVPNGTDPSTFDFHGSSFVAEAESKEAVLEQLKDDVYVTSGVWDLEKAQVFPFICAFRSAKE